jgi:hypothetical protein
MRSTQITTWPRYTKAQKRAFRARQVRRKKSWVLAFPPLQQTRKHHFADNQGSRVPTISPKGDVL